MEFLFLKLVNMSITASWLVLAVVIIRNLFRNLPKVFRVMLWGLVGIRLILPFSFESVLSLIPSSETLPENIISGPSFDIKSGIGALDNRVNEYLDDRYFEGVTVPAYNGYNTMRILSFLWITGVIAMLVYSFISYYKIARKVKESVNLKENIFICDNIPAPFVLGLISPRIFIPSDMNESDMIYVTAHEKAHIERKDHLWKPIGFLILAVYWFNPLIWLAYILLCRDIELACDEKVIKEMGEDVKKDYSTALINCSISQRAITACPLAFGETGVKERIKAVLSYKKPAFWIVATAVVLSVAIAVCFLTDPLSKSENHNYGIVSVVCGAECDNVVFEYENGTVNKQFPHINARWENKTGDLLCFGNGFELYRYGEKCRMKDGYAYNLNLNLVQNGGEYEDCFALSGFELEESGEYRIEKEFYLESDPDKKYIAYINFTVDLRYSFLGKYYAGGETVGYAGISSLWIDGDDIPMFHISDEDFSLSSSAYPKPSFSSSLYRIDGLQQIKLEKDNFDEYMQLIFWDEGYSAKRLRKENLNAFSAFDTEGRFYYLLEQKNGDIYIAQGYSGSDFKIHFIFKMDEVE